MNAADRLKLAIDKLTQMITKLDTPAVAVPNVFKKPTVVAVPSVFKKPTVVAVPNVFNLPRNPDKFENP
jgi:hypothetical protein